VDNLLRELLEAARKKRLGPGETKIDPGTRSRESVVFLVDESRVRDVVVEVIARQMKAEGLERVEQPSGDLPLDRVLLVQRLEQSLSHGRPAHACWSWRAPSALLNAIPKANGFESSCATMNGARRLRTKSPNERFSCTSSDIKTPDGRRAGH